MSDRTLRETNRGLQDELRQLRSEVRRLKQRVRYPGAVQDSGNMHFPCDGTTTGAPVAWVELDPGFWVVQAQLSFAYDDATIHDGNESYSLGIWYHTFEADGAVSITKTLIKAKNYAPDVTPIAGGFYRIAFDSMVTINQEVATRVVLYGTVTAGTVDAATMIGQVIAMPF